MLVTPKACKKPNCSSPRAEAISTEQAPGRVKEPGDSPFPVCPGILSGIGANCSGSMPPRVAWQSILLVDSAERGPGLLVRLSPRRPSQNAKYFFMFSVLPAG